MKSNIDTLIVEPSDIIRTGLQSILDEDGSFQFLAPLHDATILEERIKTMQPDLLIVNPTVMIPPVSLQMASLLQAKSNIAIVALVYQYVEPELLHRFHAVIDIREKRSQIATILKDEVRRVKDIDDENYELSEREREVLILVAQGLSSKEIADKLNISIHTVNSHRKNITRKTDIKSVAGLAVFATLHNMV
ncbi:MAG: response regulator transcription factor [Bacteroidales bacterium]|nr:response regulator transcription factor [Bacteroidales bacterium]